MGRVLLIIGALAGWIVLAVGAIVLVVAIASLSTADGPGELALGLGITVAGLAVLAPCLYFALRTRPADPYAAIAAGLPSTPWQATAPAPTYRGGGTGSTVGFVLLILGAVLGGLAVAFGLLALAIGIFDTTLKPDDRSNQLVGSWFFIIVGLAILIPCVFVLLVRQRRSNSVAIIPGSGYYSPAPGPAYPAAPGFAPTAVEARDDLSRSYVEWYGWCEQQVGADGIPAHAATMAAMAAAASGNAPGARDAAIQAAARLAQPTPYTGRGTGRLKAAKVRVLSRIGAATLPLLEPSEQVVVSIVGVDRTTTMWWHLAFGVLGALMAGSMGGIYFFTVTDRRLIAMTGRAFTGRPSHLAYAVPRSMISSLTYKKGIFGQGTLKVTRVAGERTTVTVSKMWASEAALASQLLTPAAGTYPLPAPTGFPSLPRY